MPPEKKYTQTDLDIIGLQDNIRDIKKTMAEIQISMEEWKSRFVTQDQFTPIRNIVYGMVALILTSFLGALIYLVIPLARH